MRTVIIVLAGIIMGMVWLWLSRRIKLSQNLALGIFAVIWLGLCGWNMAVGVSHGYGVMEEVPFLLANFIVPLLAVGFVAKKWLK